MSKELPRFDTAGTPGPCCGAPHDSATATSGENVGPVSGDVTLCFYCGAILFFTDGLGLCLPATGEVEGLPLYIREELVRVRGNILRLRAKG